LCIFSKDRPGGFPLLSLFVGIFSIARGKIFLSLIWFFFPQYLPLQCREVPLPIPPLPRSSFGVVHFFRLCIDPPQSQPPVTIRSLNLLDFFPNSIRCPSRNVNHLSLPKPFPPLFYPLETLFKLILESPFLLRWDKRQLFIIFSQSLSFFYVFFILLNFVEKPRSSFPPHLQDNNRSRT